MAFDTAMCTYQPPPLSYGLDYEARSQTQAPAADAGAASMLGTTLVVEATASSPLSENGRESDWMAQPVAT